MTESEIFEAVTGSGSTDFAKVVRILNQYSGWCLIDGLAVNCYVEPVFTLDADIVVVSSDLPEIKKNWNAQIFQLNSSRILLMRQWQAAIFAFSSPLIRDTRLS